MPTDFTGQKVNCNTPNVQVEWLADDGRYFASMTDHQKGLWGIGDTEDEALDDLVEVIRDAANLFGSDDAD